MTNKQIPDWYIYRGLEEPASDDPLLRLPEPPPWRKMGEKKSITFRPPPGTLEIVNAAIYLRRPLLVEGKPGTGKSSLAKAIASELGLTLYHWPINTRTTLQDGLYRYDALARLRDSQPKDGQSEAEQIGRYITLGPLGSALHDPQPSVLLIDEIDKGDIDLPNDLLHVFEEGYFDISELARAFDINQEQNQERRTTIYKVDGTQVSIMGSRVRCQNFPIVIMTSNGERDFPPAFKRRCLSLTLHAPKDQDKLIEIIKAHLGEAEYTKYEKIIAKIIKEFINKLKDVHIATDQLLNLIYMITQNNDIAEMAKNPDSEKAKEFLDTLLRPLGDG